MFELTVALKYLIPRWKQLSVSIISLISVVVISLVVWLILVFFSVSDGLHKSWNQKIIALTAPVRITPTEHYYDSYYYRVDAIAAASNYETKSIREKYEAEGADPYDPESDEMVPLSWPAPDLDEGGELRDLIKLALQSATSIPGVTAAPYENAMGNLRLKLLREGREGTTEQVLNQASYFGSLEPENRALMKTILPPKPEDLTNFLTLASVSPEGLAQEKATEIGTVPPELAQKRVEELLRSFAITALRTERPWRISTHLYPKQGSVPALALVKNGKILQVHLAPSPELEGQLKAEYVRKGTLRFDTGTFEGIDLGTAPLFVPAGTAMKSKLAQGVAGKLQFAVEMELGGARFAGTVPFMNLSIAEVCQTSAKGPCWVYEEGGKMVLPVYEGMRGVLLPKIYRESGVLIGDRGLISYYTPTTSTLQEQRVPIYVAGFYDQGVISIGGKFAWVEPEIVAMLASSSEGGDEVTGINVRFDPSDRAGEIKAQIQKNLLANGIDPYFKVESFKEYPFTRDLLQQIDSETTLFSLISCVIILVACSNIVSMLIILVNDKRLEIGILRSMGATSGSIAAIFGFCGMVMGFIGSAIGIGFAVVTLRNLGTLVDWISRVQGHALFNSRFFGDVIPNDLSGEALLFVLVATVVTSVISGVVPAIKASLMRPAAILKAE